MVSITAKSTHFEELLFPLVKIFYTLIMHYVINFVFSIVKKPYREAKGVFKGGVQGVQTPPEIFRFFLEK